MARADHRERCVLSLDIGCGDEVAHTLEGRVTHADPSCPSALHHGGGFGGGQGSDKEGVHDGKLSQP